MERRLKGNTGDVEKQQVHLSPSHNVIYSVIIMYAAHSALC